jgi:hypothetical protein
MAAVLLFGDFFQPFDIFAVPDSGSTHSGGHNQILPGRMNVPSGTRARLEGDIRTRKRRPFLIREQRIDTDIAGKKFSRPFVSESHFASLSSFMMTKTPAGG